MADLNGIEIPDDMLEGVSGGELDKTSRDNLKGIVALLKDGGYSLEETYTTLSYMEHSNDWDEIKQLIGEYYAG